MYRNRSTDPRFHERFWKRVRVSDGCWIWTGHIHTLGYGDVSCDGKSAKAHRVAWTLTHGPIPAGLFVCHKCDVKLCVRVDHLFLGTHTDNMQDMIAKGRHVTPRGVQHTQARLTEAQVRAIRQRRDEGWTYDRIAADFGVNQTQARRIVSRQNWKHVT